MNSINTPRVVIAGTNSGVGKTTIVAGLLAAYRDRGLKAQPFKVGPDYIDPGFHKLASGRDCFNLDTWLVPKQKLSPFFVDMARDADISIIEGVMGLYDGGREGVSSTAEIAKALNAPVILVIDCKAMAASAGAIALGFREFDKDLNFAGVILNRLGSTNHERMIRDTMERLNIPVIGAIHRNDKMHSPERHLGLTPVTEVDPTEAIDTIRNAVNIEVDLNLLLTIARSAPTIVEDSLYSKKQNSKRVRIGVAFDEAFSFYYPASLKALEEKGAELIYFSPLKDSVLPEVDGLLFGGGFPEMFLTQLSVNEGLRQSIKVVADAGIPIYAECGGLMYLCEGVTNFDNVTAPMVGIVPATCTMQDKLQKVGYVTATALEDNILCKKGESLKGHEFHFSITEPKTEDFPWAFEFVGGRLNTKYKGGYAYKNILATYLHLNFAGSEEATTHFIDSCESFKKQRS